MQTPLQRARCRSVGNRRSIACRANVSFTIKKKVSYGDRLIVVGDHKNLGRWKIRNGTKLRWQDGHVWTGATDIPDSEVTLEFKVVNVKGQGDPQWEGGHNRKLKIGQDDLQVELAWGNTDNGTVEASKGHKQSQSDGSGASQVESGSPTPAADVADSSDETLPQNAWQGKEIQFMRENNHTRDRSGIWNTDGLEGPVLHLVQGDQSAGSWLQKLERVKGVLVEAAEDMRPSLDTLAPVYVYLQWIATGSIPCVESGGHHRPNKHSELSKIMFRSLEWVVGDSGKLDIERWVARRMQAKLPSFSESFTASVPLTRIRDIAHRNDIPSDLKREIKHTLQNKLHRNAGPEDLVATEAMLARITGPGAHYSGDFVNEFKIFTEELRDFFNAGSLTKVLNGLVPSLDDSAAADVGRFLDAKGKLEQAGGENSVVDCMHQLTSVRSQLAAGLATGLRNDAPDTAMITRQKWRLAELRCEDYAFILLSRYLNEISTGGTSALLTDGRQDVWAKPLGMLVLSVRHLGLSGWQPAECLALDTDLVAWQKLGATTCEEDTLRLKASLERMQRLTTHFVDGQLAAFTTPSKQLQGALGLPDRLQGVFTEAEIRASVAFQLSKLNTLLLQACRSILKMGAFDGIVPGSAVGELVQVESIEPGMALANGKPCVLLVQSASGDEEITTAGANIKGVMLCQELPHLSHLGVRARQERVPFATCSSPEVAQEKLHPLVGSAVTLDVTAETVAIMPGTPSAKVANAAAASLSTNGSGSATPAVPTAVAAPAFTKASDIEKVDKLGVLPVSKATAVNAGAKATVCSELAVLAGERYSTPRGAVLPFGSMELVLAQSGEEKQFAKYLEMLESATVGKELDAACLAMQQLMQASCLPPAELLVQLQKELEGAGIVIARSSANVEDLAGLSGAGLYESIPNLKLEDGSSLADGIAQVWASLYSRRAVLSRRAAGVAQKDACMAVLVQEMLAPAYSFVLHTRNPLAASGTGSESDLYAEIAPGMGETLASGTAGSAWRLTSGGKGSVTMRAFANFSEAFMPVSSSQGSVPVGHNIYGTTRGAVLEKGMVSKQTVAYSTQALSNSEDVRKEVGVKLFEIGKYLETELKGPQDVEGAAVGKTIYIVQSRPQP